MQLREWIEFEVRRWGGSCWCNRNCKLRVRKRKRERGQIKAGSRIWLSINVCDDADVRIIHIYRYA